MPNIVQNEFNKLIEVSPVLSKNIINSFNKTFPNKVSKINGKNIQHLEITKPEICNAMISVSKNIYNSKNQVSRTN